MQFRISLIKDTAKRKGHKMIGREVEQIGVVVVDVVEIDEEIMRWILLTHLSHSKVEIPCHLITE